MVDARAVRAWLAAKGVTKCPVCRSDDLQVSKDLYALVCVAGSSGGPDLQRGSRAVRLRCGGCSHLMLFHARQMGLEA
ncbi:MAG: hypothetical protein O2894_03365 [Planctomycetota bacterium]|nr:hypothetical protein [Planctomycetota bacterium]